MKTKNDKNNKKKSKFSCFLSKFSIFLEKYLFPEDIKCIFCGKDISSFYSKPYCSYCEKEIKFNYGNKCKICDERIYNEAKICERCMKNKYDFKKIFCPLIYEGITRKTILAYKQDNKRYLAKGFAQIIYDYIGENFKYIDIITYVTITEKRLKERSFNQSQKLAEELSKLANLPCVNCLEKIKETSDQKKLNFSERKKNLKNCFKVINKKDIKGKNVLLVDDIISTCATVQECSNMLKNYANNIYVTAIARNIINDKN